MAVAGLLGGIMWVGASPALARTLHAFSFSFGSQGSGAGQLSSPQDVAVNDTTGDIYVADTGNDRIDEFDSSGNFIQAWGWGVADGASSFETCTTSCQAGVSGNGVGQFESPIFVAVDNSTGPSAGDVYVGDTGTNLVQKFTADGAVVSSWGDGGGSSCGTANGQLSGACATGGPFTGIAGITVDGSGDLNVYDPNSENWFVFSRDGTPQPTISVGRGTDNVGIGVDSDGNLYKVVGDGNLEQYSSSGSDIGDVTDDQTGSEITGFAIDPTTNDIYADDGGAVIRHYDGSALATCVPAGDCSAADTFGAGHLSDSAAGVAFDTANGAIDVADPSANQVDVFTATVLPDASTDPPTDVTGTSATLNGTVNPDGTTLNASGGCQFELVDTVTSVGQSVPCQSTPSGSSPTAVSADVSGLAIGTVYRDQVQATNSSGTTSGAFQSFTTSGQTIDAESASDASDKGVTLNAQINPQGTDTTYHFEYGTAGPCSSNTCTSIPTDQEIGSGTTDVAVSQTLSSLPAGTTYYYRAVATSSKGVVDGPDQRFATTSAPGPATTSTGCPNAALMTGPSAKLPDCRAYEQVTPTNKDGDDPQTYPGVAEAASTGNAVTFYSKSSFPGAVGSGRSPQLFISTRGSDGWSTSGLIPPQTLGSASAIEGWTPDLTWSLATAGNGGTGGGSLYLENTASDSWTPIASYGPNSAGAYALNGVATDGSSAVFSSNNQLTESAPSGQHVEIYAWSASTGELTLANVLPDGSLALGGPGFDGVGGATADAVASDGSAVVFSGTADADEDGGTNQVFLREDPIAPDASTVEASASQKTNGNGPGGIDPNGPQPATFAAASPDTGEVVFTSPEELTNDANTGSADQGNDAYEYDVSSGQLTDLSVPNSGVTDTDPNGAEVQGVLGMSDDGSYVYFVANGVLAAGAPLGDCQPNGGYPTGDCDLYVWHDGTIMYITQLTAGDGNTTPGNADYGSDATDWETGPNQYETDPNQTAWVTPDGATTLFESALPVTGYDNTPSNPSACTDQGDDPVGCTELYRYDANSGQLTCVSCDASGAPPTGDVDLAMGDVRFGGQGAVPRNLAPVQTRNLSSSGDQVFFQSPDPLLAQDDGGQPDIYEWEADGAGSCVTAGGCLYSISTGQGSGDYLIDASASGSDLLFATWQQLVGQDQDDIIDIYDARVDGGIASQNPPPAPAPCQGEDCKPPPSSAAPTTPTPVSVTFTGPGNRSGTDAASVKVIRRVALDRSVAVEVSVPSAGKIRVSGSDLRGASRTVARAGRYRLTVPLARGAIRSLKRHHTLRLRMQVVFAPSDGGTASATVTLTVKERSR